MYVLHVIIDVNNINHHFNVFYMYLHGYVHVHQYNDVAFTALC